MFEGQQLNNINIKQYTNNEQFINKQLYDVPCLLQNDYGGLCDCTLTSITALIKYIKPVEEIENIYNKVEQIAKKYCYKEERGVKTVIISLLLKEVYRQFKINKKVKGCYLKGIGFDYEDIKREIDNNNPMLLNLWKDGRNYYHDHTVLIIGYYYTSKYKMIGIYDNWNKGISYIDYKKLNSICSIQI